MSAAAAAFGFSRPSWYAAAEAVDTAGLPGLLPASPAAGQRRGCLLLNVLCFLATTVRFDLSAALDEWRGFDHIQRQADDTGPVRITIEGHVTQYSSTNAPDSYTLTLTRRAGAAAHSHAPRSSRSSAAAVRAAGSR